MDFTYLNVTSIYSFHDSALTPSEYSDGLNSYGFSSGGACDFNSLRCFADYESTFKKHDKKFLAGIRSFLVVDGFKFECLIYLRNYDGYRFVLKNIVNLKKEEISLDDIRGHGDDIVLILRTNSNSDSAFFFFDNLVEDGGKVFAKIYKNFGDYFVGVEYYSSFEKDFVDELRQFGKEHSLNLVAIPEVRYLNRQLSKRYDLLQAIKKKEKYEESQALFYLLGPNALAKLYTEDEIKNTLVIKDMCDFSMFERKVKQIDFGNNKESLLRSLINNALEENNFGEEYYQRAEEELEVIKKTNFIDYFLLVNDYVSFAKNNDIKVGPGRGSAASSLIAYLLNITDIDPIKYDLIFERFLNTDRLSMPDIDIDFEDDKRELVINYLKQKYGESSIKHIITYSTYRSSSAINAIGEVFGVAKERLKLLTSNLVHDKSIAESIEQSFYLKKLYNDSYYHDILNSAMLIEGLLYNSSIHASGIIASFDNLDDDIYSEGDILGYEYSFLEKMGYLKLDILGLSNLSFIRRIENEVEKFGGKCIGYKELNIDDKKVFDLLKTGATYGIFQLESKGMKDLIKSVEPSSFSDLLALIALYRPGPMDNIPLFIKNKNNKVWEQFTVDEVNEIIKSTYGIIVYQEQIMRIVRSYANLTNRQADMFRYAIAKKDLSRIKSNKELFFTKAKEANRSEEEIEKLYNWIENFAGYGFNKAHTVSYSYITYLLLYYKTYYPEAFFHALGENVSLELVEDLKQMNKKIEVCNVYNSKPRLQINDDVLTLGLSSIHGLSSTAIDVLSSIDLSDCNIIEEVFRDEKFIKIPQNDILKLIDAGYFDVFNINREKLRNNLSSLLSIQYCEEGNYIRLDYYKDNPFKDYYLERKVLGVNLSSSLKNLVKQKDASSENLYLIVSPINYNKTEYEAINDYGKIKLSFSSPNEFKEFEVILAYGKYKRKVNTLYIDSIRRLYE